MKTFDKFLAISIILFLISCNKLVAQGIHLPTPSPTATLEQQVGLGIIKISYSRPGVKDRVIFGDLVPYNTLWRTGANMATTISFSRNVKIENQDLKAGNYALFTIPGPDEWTLIFNKNTDQDGVAEYDASEDALRVKVPSGKMDQKIETLLLDINDIRDNSASLWLAWDHTFVKAELKFDVDGEIMASIDKALNPAVDAGTYFAAARYYYDTDRDLNKALSWINKSIEQGNEMYWVIHLKANILQKMGNCAEAIKAAERSKELADKAGNPDYVRLNEKLIASCK